MKKTILLIAVTMMLGACVKDDNSALNNPTGHYNSGTGNICGDANPGNCVVANSCSPLGGSSGSVTATGVKAGGFFSCANSCVVYSNAQGLYYSSCL